MHNMGLFKTCWVSWR